MEEIERTNQGKIRTLREELTEKYLRILEAETIKQDEIKETIKILYLRRTSKLLETKLYNRNFIKGINTWAVSLVRYLETSLKWTWEELQQRDQRTGKLMTERLYRPIKEGGK